MARKPPRRPADESARPKVVKITLSLSLDTATRLAVEASMRRVSQSQVAEEVLAPYLKRWRLPSTVEDKPPAPAEPTGDAA